MSCKATLFFASKRFATQDNPAQAALALRVLQKTSLIAVPTPALCEMVALGTTVSALHLRMESTAKPARKLTQTDSGEQSAEIDLAITSGKYSALTQDHRELVDDFMTMLLRRQRHRDSVPEKQHTFTQIAHLLKFAPRRLRNAATARIIDSCIALAFAPPVDDVPTYDPLTVRCIDVFQPRSGAALDVDMVIFHECCS